MRRVQWALAVVGMALAAGAVFARGAKRAPAGDDARAAAEEGMVSLKGHTDGITALAFSPDGKLLASGSGDRTIIIWDVHSGKQLHRLEGHEAAITSLNFSPDGKYLVSSAAESTIDLWNTKTWQIDSLYQDVDPVLTVRFLGASDGFVSFGPWALSMWQVGSGAAKARRMSPDALLSAMTIANDEIVYGDRNGNLAVWDGTDQDPTVIHRRPKASKGRNFVVGLGQGRAGHVMVTDEDGLWDWDRGTDKLSLVAQDWWGDPVVMDHGKYVATAYGARLWLCEPELKEGTMVFKTGFPVHAVAVSPTGEYWAYGGRGEWSSMTEWRRGYASEVRLLKVGNLAHAFALAAAQGGEEEGTGAGPARMVGWDEEGGGDAGTP
ncbi:MAG TPA: hypothetical protein VHQ47_12590 [Phycisphaerae bacterium]|nr:hypothetical protein [Phycisphaerae bacterium]